jgi:branched-chain amino acid aminotransferase
MSFICINGDILSETTPAVSVHNRSFNFGDGLVEEMRTRGDVVLFLDDHLNNLQKAMTILKMNTGSLPSKSEIEFAARRLIHRNNLLKSSCLRLLIIRKTGATQEDLSGDIEYCMTAQPLETSIFTIPAKGLIVNIYTDIPKLISPLSGIRTTSCIQTVLALIKAKEKGVNDMLLLNTAGNIIESIHSNLFVVQDNEIFTPPLSDGCVNSVMRKIIIEIAKENKFNIIDTQSLGTTNLYSATEILLANSVNGIQWVTGYRNTRYFKHTAKKLTELLNYKAGLQD